MKRRGILHPELAMRLAQLGHMDRVCGGNRIDLAYVLGKPPFFEVLQAFVDECVFERACWANESELDPEMTAEFRWMTGIEQPDLVSHDQFKKKLSFCKLVVRTGECRPYCNIILSCGVPF